MGVRLSNLDKTNPSNIGLHNVHLDHFDVSLTVGLRVLNAMVVCTHIGRSTETDVRTHTHTHTQANTRMGTDTRKYHDPVNRPSIKRNKQCL